MDSNRVIVVVGASSGIGEQVARLMAREGATIGLVARRESELRRVLNDLPGSKHELYNADFSDVDCIRDVVVSIVDKQGRIDGLVYSAGISPSYPIKLLSPEKMRTVFDINFHGFIETVRQITWRGRYNEGLKIVALSSAAASRGNKAHTAYAASKAAIEGAIRCLAKELAEKGITINAVAPSMTSTRMYDDYLSAYGEESETNQSLLQRQYLGIVDPVAVAETVSFLLGPDSRFITGQVIPVDGGFLSN